MCMLKRSFIKNEITSCLNPFLWKKTGPGKKDALRLTLNRSDPMMTFTW